MSESLGELEKACSPKLPHVFLKLDRNMENMFLIPFGKQHEKRKTFC